MKRAVCFDIGNTLILGHPELWLEPILQARGLAFQGDPLRAAMDAFAYYEAHHMEGRNLARGLAVWRAVHRRMLGALGLEHLVEDLSEYLIQNWRTPSLWPLAPHAKETLSRLRERDVTLVVVSNWDASLPHILEVTGLAPYFDQVVVSALEGVAKPDPEIFRRALEPLGISPDEALHVGDARTDIEGAGAAGVDMLLFDAYGHRPQAIHDLREVLRAVEADSVR